MLSAKQKDSKLRMRLLNQTAGEWKREADGAWKNNKVEKMAGTAIKSKTGFVWERKEKTYWGGKSIKNIVCVNLGICCVYLKHNHLVRPSICQNYPREAHEKEASEGTWHLKKAQSIKTQHAAVNKFGNSKRSLQSPECSGVFVFMHMQMCV